MFAVRVRGLSAKTSQQPAAEAAQTDGGRGRAAQWPRTRRAWLADGGGQLAALAIHHLQEEAAGRKEGLGVSASLRGPRTGRRGW